MVGGFGGEEEGRSCALSNTGSVVGFGGEEEDRSCVLSNNGSVVV